MRLQHFTSFHMSCIFSSLAPYLERDHILSVEREIWNHIHSYAHKCEIIKILRIATTFILLFIVNTTLFVDEKIYISKHWQKSFQNMLFTWNQVVWKYHHGKPYSNISFNNSRFSIRLCLYKFIYIDKNESRTHFLIFQDLFYHPSIWLKSTSCHKFTNKEFFH